MRVISGTARGRRFDAPKGMIARPTTDRVKESIFGIIQFDIPGSIVLDLFSGSGSLAIESLSRGASFAFLNDSDKGCVAQIRTNINALGFSQCAEILNLDAYICLKRLKDRDCKFDFIFLDPPYGKKLELQAIREIRSLGILQSNGRIVLERRAGDDSFYELPTIDIRKYRDTEIVFLGTKEE